MPYLQPATDTPFGAIPYGRIYSLTKYRKDASAARIYPGDFIIMEADGNVAPATAGALNIIGVAADASAGSTADTEVMVYDDPNQLFVVQDDSDGTAMDETSIGANADILATAGNTTTDRSAHEIDSSSVTASTANLAIKGLHPMELDSARVGFATATGQWRKWIVKINEHLDKVVNATVAGSVGPQGV
jgi:hypothetical protein